MSDEITAIRARWAGVAWSYEVGRDGDYVYSACLSVGDDGDGAILLDEPSAQEQATLALAAQAPGDMAALFARIRAIEADAAVLRRAILGLMPYAPAGTPQDLPPMAYAAVRAVDQAIEQRGAGAALLAELTVLRELYQDVQRWRESGGDSRDLLYVVETAEKIERGGAP